ncbi:uncharacterized protein LOC106948711 [Poecilia latipinna]|uniref:uncharacterized protein LOC106948711 n=1 Tax=Poecilia latipinna TaxID=48699 RepID=UPI00072DF0E4|nr:PREDICTED: uncharacterized protein LOC106948711 [Poecilia latipinna]
MSPACKSPWEAAEFNLSSHLQLVLEGVEYGFKQQLFFFSSPECLLTSISSCPLAVLARTVLPGFRVSLSSPRCGLPTSVSSLDAVGATGQTPLLVCSPFPFVDPSLVYSPSEASGLGGPSPNPVGKGIHRTTVVAVPPAVHTCPFSNLTPALVAAQIVIPFLPIRRPGHQLQYSLPDPPPDFNKTYYCTLYRSLLFVFLHVGS